MPIWGGYCFQDGSSYLMEQLNFFHDHSLVVLLFVCMLVFHFVYMIYFFLSFDRGVSEGHEIEFLWTVLPAILLIFIAFPSLQILYLMDEEFGGAICYKVVGHQWYWSYEYSDFFGVAYDSFLLSTESCRLLDNESRLYSPFRTPLRFLVTSQDVLHSWAMPSMGVSADAMPGRLNQLTFVTSFPGLFFGQCSELCGANHSFMPISLESVSTFDYLTYVSLF